MSQTEQLMFVLELVISFEVLWDVSCRANGREARGGQPIQSEANLISKDFMFLSVLLLGIPTRGFRYPN